MGFHFSGLLSAVLVAVVSVYVVVLRPNWSHPWRNSAGWEAGTLLTRYLSPEFRQLPDLLPAFGGRHRRRHHGGRSSVSNKTICDDFPPDIPPPDTNATTTLCVDRRGCCNFTSVQAAVDAINATSQKRTVIWINKGIYFEKVRIPSSKPNITLQGQGLYSTAIVWNDTANSSNGTYFSASISVFAANFVAKNISFMVRLSKIADETHRRSACTRSLFLALQWMWPWFCRMWLPYPNQATSEHKPSPPGSAAIRPPSGDVGSSARRIPSSTTGAGTTSRNASSKDPSTSSSATGGRSMRTASSTPSRPRSPPASVSSMAPSQRAAGPLRRRTAASPSSAAAWEGRGGYGWDERGSGMPGSSMRKPSCPTSSRRRDGMISTTLSGTSSSSLGSTCAVGRGRARRRGCLTRRGSTTPKLLPSSTSPTSTEINGCSRRRNFCCVTGFF